MSPPYRVTLVQLTADAAALAPSGDKVELGHIPAEEIYRLAGRLIKINFSANPKAEPGILVQRGDKGWRIAVHQGRLCMHKSMSLFDDVWTADSPEDLAQLPPFRVSAVRAPIRRRMPRAYPGVFKLCGRWRRLPACLSSRWCSWPSVCGSACRKEN